MFARKNPKIKSLKKELELSLERIRIDYVSSFEGKHFLVIADSYTKWLEVQEVSNTNSKLTVRVIRGIFTTSGFTYKIIDDGTS